MSLEDLQSRIVKFRDERNWKQFHNIKDLLLALNIEVGELSELFLWKDKEQIQKIDKHRIEEEVADVFIYLTYICNEYNIDLTKIVNSKIDLNNSKYPINKSFNSNKKYNEL